MNISNVPGVALYFYILQGMRSSMTTIPFFAARNVNGQNQLSVLPKVSSHGNLLAGALARVSVGLVLNPFTLLKARFEVCVQSCGSCHVTHNVALRATSILTALSRRPCEMFYKYMELGDYCRASVPQL